MKTTLCLMLCAGVLSVPPSLLALPPEPGAPEDLNQSFQIIQRVRPAFPSRLLRRGVTSGEVRLFLDVDASGVLVDQLVVGYTHRELAEVLEDAVRYWQYIPAEAEGRAFATTANVLVRFETSGIVLVEHDPLEGAMLAQRGYAYFAREVDELDKPLKAQRAPSPANPARYGEPAVIGRAQVDFFVDEKGHVRMPVVVSADDERLGWAAVSAMSQWRFDPPLRKGRPILVRATQTFRFEGGGG